MSVYLGHQVINTLRAFQGHLCLLRSIALSLSGRIYPQRGRIQRPIQTYKPIKERPGCLDLDRIEESLLKHEGIGVAMPVVVRFLNKDC